MRHLGKAMMVILVMATAETTWGVELPSVECDCENANRVAGFVSRGPAGCTPGSKRVCHSRWCPDDYRPKAYPTFCRAQMRGCCDDYLPRCSPRFCLPPTCGCHDDYCPRPAPCVCWPCRWPESYRCPPSCRYPVALPQFNPTTDRRLRACSPPAARTSALTGSSASPNLAGANARMD